ncbi:transposase [Mycobacterium tuberculosis]|nr:transposase [Mycobacterium tuberculosis]
MRNVRLFRALLGVDKRTVIEDIEFEEDDAGDGARVIARVRPRSAVLRRCGRCGRKASWYDRGAGLRQWRSLDWGTVEVFLEAEAPRVNCPTHGPTVVAVPWARHHAGHTYAFDDTVAWLAVACSKTAVCELMRIAWRTVGAIVARVWADTEKRIDRFANLRRIGIDEISYKRHHRYLTVVVDHDSGRLVWAAPGHDKATLGLFFDALGAERAAQITHVSADAADWIADVVTERCPDAIQCADPFHVVAWATEALDVERRRAWNDARAIARTEPKWGRGRPGKNAAPRPGRERARRLKGARYALWKNPEDLTERQSAKLAWIAKTDPRLYRAYLLKESLRHVFSVKGEEGKQALDRWISWAQRCRIPVFVEPCRPHQTPPGGHRRRPRPRPIPRPDRIHQHQDPPTDPDRVRIPLTTSPHRPSHAHPRRPPPHPARPTQPPTDQSVEPNSYRIWGLLRLLALPS